jgi:uncharacterized protein DUF6603
MSDQPKKDERKKSSLKRLFQWFQDVNQWAQETVGDDDTRRAMLMDLGLPPDLPPGAPPAKYPANDLPSITKYRENEKPDHAAFLEAIEDIKAMYEAGRAFVKAYKDSEGDGTEAALEELTHRFFELMALNYIRTNLPGLYWIGQPLGLIEEQLTIFSPGQTHLGRIANFFKDIGGHFKQIRGGLDDDAQAEAWTDTILLGVTGLSFLLAKIGGKNQAIRRLDDWLGHAYYGWDPDPKSSTPLLDKVAGRTVTFSYKDTSGSVALVPRAHGGPGVLIALGGAFDFKAPLWEGKALQIGINATSAVDFLARLDSFKAVPNATLPKLNFKLVDMPTDGKPNTTLLPTTAISEPAKDSEFRWTLGNEKGTHLDLGGISFGVELSEEGLGVSVSFADSALVIRDGDSFVVEALGSNDSRLPFHFGLGFKSGGNVFLEGGLDGGLKLVIPSSRSLGKARLQFLTVALEPEISGGKRALTLETAAALDVALGPVKASIDQIGFRLRLDFDAEQKNLGFANLDVGFKPPNGIGLVIDAKAVKGGGFLYLDAPQGQYAGAVHLETKGGIAIKGLGLLNTKFPDGSTGFSLLVIITVEGFRWPIGMGFTITGLGGLLGVNRTVNTTALQAGVRNRTLDAVLFPKDPVRNAPQYLNALKPVFPPARDSYLFGPMAQIVWGGSVKAPLLTIRLALVLELGDGFHLKKFVIMGQLTAKMPTPENDLVRLNMDAIGIVDFDQQTASLDAALYDSRLSKTFVITGAMAMRLRWGNQPAFALAIGGFHPAFTPPQGFPALERVSITLVNEENLKLLCQAYFAITSNTVQFGARAYLFAKKAGFSVEGEIGFDVLIQFDPFHFLAGFYASLQLKRGSTNLFKVRLEGQLEGPRPLKVRGKATFEILWWDYSVSFDRTLISGEKPPPPAPVSVAPLLKQALNEPASWSVALPPLTTNLVTFRETAPVSEIMAHPFGTLAVKQNVVPLKLRITRFGAARPTESQPFSIQKVMVGDQVDTAQREVEDFFAPAQFRDFTDDEKMSAPSFQKFSAGVQFGSEQISAGVGLAADVLYEEKIFTKEGVTSPSSHTPSENTLFLFGHLSAAARREVRLQATSKYQAKAILFTAPEKMYQIVSTKEVGKLVNLPDAPTSEFRTWAEANAAIWQARQNLREEVKSAQIIEIKKTMVP